MRRAVVAALLLAGTTGAGPATAAECRPFESGSPPYCFSVRDCPPGYSGWMLYWNDTQIGSDCQPETGGQPCSVMCVVDWYACPVLALMAPGIPGVVDIRPDGDVDIAGPFWDCPPYAVTLAG